jgi:hypothetical protein
MKYVNLIEAYCFLGCEAVYSGSSSVFNSNMLPPFMEDDEIRHQFHLKH